MAQRPRSGRRQARRLALLAGAAFGVAAVSAALVSAVAIGLPGVPAAFGGKPTGDRAERMRRSPQFRDGKFHNSVPSTTLQPGTSRKVFREFLRRDSRRTPKRPIPVLPAPPAVAGTGLHVTWYGHASTLIEIEGRRVLIDPIWSERCSPSQHVGPRRLHKPPVTLSDLPPVDAVIISHDHYDHLDQATIEALTRGGTAPFLVPLGVGAHLDRWGVPADRIIELDWSDETTVAGIRFVLTPARHFSGRGLTRDTTLWGSWVIAGESRRVFYTGDTGYFDGFAAIGAQYGPFDVALVQVGAYGEGWPDIHMTPEDGLRAHLDVGGRLLIPVHWCTFVLSVHPWSEPVDRVWREAKERQVAVAIPRPGERVDVDNPPEVEAWWETVV